MGHGQSLDKLGDDHQSMIIGIHDTYVWIPNMGWTTILHVPHYCLFVCMYVWFGVVWFVLVWFCLVCLFVCLFVYYSTVSHHLPATSLYITMTISIFYGLNQPCWIPSNLTMAHMEVKPKMEVLNSSIFSIDFPSKKTSRFGDPSFMETPY